MGSGLSAETTARIHAFCRQITAGKGLGEDIYRELTSHMEDKVQAYLDATEEINETDAFLLVEHHFGNQGRVRELLQIANEGEVTTMRPNYLFSGVTMHSSTFRRLGSQYGIAAVHALLGTTIIAAAIVHTCRVFTSAQPHIGLPLLGVFFAFGILAILSFIFPAKLRGLFFGLFATLIMVNAVDDLSRWGFIQHLWCSYALGLLALLLSISCLCLTLAHRANHTVEVGGVA
jgi:hypothetical protein